ncbi:uncharacterized protein PgNI_08776 [Pyricularia grisea]|uniref:Extracellular membrane protein CFEM domain-containing protein n=1 Tax=Pyricularia grisea TaxID=148305 RepID=A0A6P8AVN9_PYRGI|nr:uncharacterized protein PgNI_08776 [Pyricularia grisea]TLD06265.1 hypothetical protein PgNI_08776 [Pyricularia grisea]
MKTTFFALVGAVFATVALAGKTTSICMSVYNKQLTDSTICTKAGAEYLGNGICCIDSSKAIQKATYESNCDEQSGTVKDTGNACS